MTQRIVLALSCIFKVRGGIPRFNQMLCLAMDQLAPELDFSGTVLSQDDAEEDYRQSGAPWRNLRFVEGGGARGLSLRAAAVCLAHRPDVLLLGLLGMTPVGLALRPLVRRGYGFISHGMEAWAEARVSRRLAARNARFAFVVSRNTGDQLCRATGLAPERLRVIPNTLDPALGLEGGSPPPQPDAAAALEILTVSRLWGNEHLKGVDHTLEVVARLVPSFPDLRYRVIGKGDDKPRLLALAASLGIAQRVIFEENLSDAELADRYRRCSVFVLPSGQEGFGIVFLEAMVAGKACVGARAGGIPEVVEDGVTGLLIPHGDREALTRGLGQLLQDPALRESMGREGRRRVLEHFTFHHFRARLSEYLKEWFSGA